MSLDKFRAYDSILCFNQSDRIEDSNNSNSKNFTILSCYFYHMKNRSIAIENTSIMTLIYESYFENNTYSSEHGAAIFFSSNEPIIIKRSYGKSNCVKSDNQGHFAYFSSCQSEISDTTISESGYKNDGHGQFAFLKTNSSICSVNISNSISPVDAGIMAYSSNINYSYSLLDSVFACYYHGILVFMISESEISHINLNNCTQKETDNSYGLIMSWIYSTLYLKYSSVYNSGLSNVLATYESYIEVVGCYLPNIHGNVSTSATYVFPSKNSLKIFNLVYNYEIITVTCNMKLITLNYKFAIYVFIFLIE